MKPVLSAKKISKSYNRPIHVDVLSEISLDVYAGQTLAITGKSGEGKSTLLHILGTLEKPTSGTLEICGEVPTSTTTPTLRNRRIGFIFQSFNLLENDTVLTNVLMPAKIARHDTSPKSSAYLHACALLEEMGLGSRMHFPAKILSGGEKQRAAIARALCNDPTLIFADEPSGNLDQAHSTLIHELLLTSAKKRGKALIIVTHDTYLASMCDTTYYLTDRKLIT